MFELDINKIKEQSMQFVDTAYKAAMDIADKGKNQLDLASQQNRLAKAQRQLGALVYSLHKAEEENQPLVDKYIENIAEIEKAIEEIKARMTPDEAAAAEAGMSKKDAEKAVNAALAAITEELKNGGKVSLVGFGTFEVRERPERQGRNPQTKEPMTIAASKLPAFKAGKALKDAVQ